MNKEKIYSLLLLMSSSVLFTSLNAKIQINNNALHGQATVSDFDKSGVFVVGAKGDPLVVKFEANEKQELVSTSIVAGNHFTNQVTTLSIARSTPADPASLYVAYVTNENKNTLYTQSLDGTFRENIVPEYNTGEGLSDTPEILEIKAAPYGIFSAIKSNNEFGEQNSGICIARFTEGLSQTAFLEVWPGVQRAPGLLGVQGTGGVEYGGAGNTGGRQGARVTKPTPVTAISGIKISNPEDNEDTTQIQFDHTLPTLVPNHVTLAYDTDFDLLYVGLRGNVIGKGTFKVMNHTIPEVRDGDNIVTALEYYDDEEPCDETGNALKVLLIVDPNNLDDFKPLFAGTHGAVLNDPTNNSSNIVGCTIDHDESDNSEFAIHKMAVMTTESKHKYLIISGGLVTTADAPTAPDVPVAPTRPVADPNGENDSEWVNYYERWIDYQNDVDDYNNFEIPNYLEELADAQLVLNASKAKIFALPLCEYGSNRGSLAKVINRETGEVDFLLTAQSNDDLFTENDTPARVGDGDPLPVTISASFSINQIQTVGNTVFCSTSDDDYINGIYFSTAIENPDGSIREWTRWEFALPTKASGDFDSNNEINSSVSHFAVDAVKGHVYVIPTETPTLVKLASHGKNDTLDPRNPSRTTLDQKVNALLGNKECYCTERLAYNNYDDYSSKHDFALFGGNGVVVIAKTNFLFDPSGPNSYEPVNFWDDSNTIAITKGIEGLKVQSLSWTDQNNDNVNSNFILAGTNQGLYALVNPNNDYQGLQGSDEYPSQTLDFKDWEFKKIEALSNENVIKVISIDEDNENAQANIILTQTVDDTNKLCNKLWILRAYNNETVTELSDHTTLIWDTSSEDSKDGVKVIRDIAHIDENIIVATDKGIYTIPTSDNDLAAIRFDLDALTNNTFSLFTPEPSWDNYTLHFATNKTIPTGKSTTTLGALGKIIIEDGTGRARLVQSPYKLAEYNNNDVATAGKITAYSSHSHFRFYAEESLDSNNKRITYLRSLPYANGEYDYNITEPVNVLTSPVSTVYGPLKYLGAGYYGIPTSEGFIPLG